MKKRDLLFVAAVIAVLAALYLLSISGRKPPAIPSDEAHIAAKAKEDCLVCHSPEGANPLKQEHPPKDQCFECHKMKTEGN